MKTPLIEAHSEPRCQNVVVNEFLQHLKENGLTICEEHYECGRIIYQPVYKTNQEWNCEMFGGTPAELDQERRQILGYLETQISHTPD